jgi:hypothetical protein
MRKTNHPLILLVAASVIITACSKKVIDDDPSNLYAQVLDAKFEQQLIDLQIDSDGIINQKVLKSDAVSVEKLILTNTQIQNLKGIEAFINLKRLYVGGNDLTAVDLSKNVLLDTLDLAGNKLKTVDLSFNAKLIYSDLYGNELTTVTGLGSATNLNYLSLSFNYLTEFSIENPNLETLNIDNNDIENFDAYLGENLKTLIMYTNKVKTIDFSNNLNLRILRVADNKLTNLTLGQKDELFYLSCSNNYLSSLNVSRYNKLTKLYVSENPNLKCIKIKQGQQIAIVGNSTYQEFKTNCN